MMSDIELETHEVIKTSVALPWIVIEIPSSPETRISVKDLKINIIQ
jgi:hypothetical protein